MAIVENASFEGSPVYDVDSGAPTLARLIKNAQGDVAGTLRHLTDKTDALCIDHSGGAKGSLLGIPWVSQWMGKSLELGASGAKDGGADANTQQFPYLLRVPPGETSVVVEVVGQFVTTDGAEPSVRLSLATDFNTAAGSTLEQRLRKDADDDGFGPNASTWSCRFDGVTSALVLATLLFPNVTINGDVSGNATSQWSRINSVDIRPARAPVAIIAGQGTTPNPTGVVAPTSTQALFHQSMDESIFTDGEGMTGWHTSRLDRNINGLMEFETAAPAGYNGAYTHTESALRNPTRDRFRAFTRKTFTLEPVPIMPMCSVCFGGIKSNGGYLVDPALPASVAARKAFAPFPVSGTIADLGVQRMHLPDLPTGVVRWAVLLGQSNVVGWTNIRAQVQIEGNAISAAVPPTAVTGATHLGLAQGTALAFARDSLSNRLRVRPSQVAGGFFSTNYCVLAVAVWTEE